MAGKKAPIAVTVAVDDDTQVREDFVKEIDGVELRLPSLSYMKVGTVRRLRHLSQTDAAYTLLEMHLSPEALAEVDKMDIDAFGELLKDWREHSGVTLGES